MCSNALLLDHSSEFFVLFYVPLIYVDHTNKTTVKYPRPIAHYIKWTTIQSGPPLTLKVLVTTIDAQWEGMGDLGSARYEPALLPPCPTIRVLNCSKLSESQHFKG